MMNDADRFTLCLKELDVIQANIARFDTNGLQLKGFCITTLSALSAYAKGAGVAPSVLAAVESGTRQPGAPRRRRLLQELDASFDELFTVRVL